MSYNCDMEIRLSQRLNDILEYAREEAMRTGRRAISADHLTLGILRDADNDACRALADLGIDTAEMKRFIDAGFKGNGIVPFGDSDKISVTRSAQSAINMAALEALKSERTEVSPAHLILAVSRIQGSASRQFLENAGLGTDRLSGYLKEKGLLLNSARAVTPSPQDFMHIINIPNINTKTIS